MDRSKLLAGGLLLAGMVVGSGMIHYVLTAYLGYDTLGDAVYVVGYVTGITLFYLFWLRPLDLRSPTGSDRPDEVEADPDR